MARIYENKHSLQKEHYKYKKRWFVFTVLFIAGFAIWILNVQYFHFFNSFFATFLFVGFIVFSTLATGFGVKTNTLKAGLEGKQQTLGFLSSLPDIYSVVINPAVTFQGQVSNLDTVIVGPNGVFVIQTKNHNGTIEGVYTDEHFTQHKIGQKGTPYSSRFYSPIKQVSTHVFRLSKLLQEHGYNVWVQGIVYFSNMSAIVNVDYIRDEIPVFAASQGGGIQMCNYISSFRQKSTISYEDVEKISGIIA